MTLPISIRKARCGHGTTNDQINALLFRAIDDGSIRLAGINHFAYSQIRADVSDIFGNKLIKPLFVFLHLSLVDAGFIDYYHVKDSDLRPTSLANSHA
jgi:hypothetical protein